MDIAQVGAVAIALLTAIVIWRQLLAGNRAARRERAAALAAIWADREFRTMLSPTLAFLRVGNLHKCIQSLAAWSGAPRAEEPWLRAYPDFPGALTVSFVRKNDILHVLGAVEEVSIQYNANQADRPWVAQMLGRHLIQMLQDGLWLVCFLRRNDMSTYSEWVRAVSHLRRPLAGRPRLAHVFKESRDFWERRWQRRRGVNLAELTKQLPDQEIRVMCIPPGPTRVSDPNWERNWKRAADLAELLADSTLEDRFLKLYPRVYKGEPSDDVWRAIRVPVSLDATGRQIAALDQRREGKFHPVLWFRSIIEDLRRRIEMTSSRKRSTLYWVVMMLITLVAGFLVVDRFIFSGSHATHVALGLGIALLVGGVLAARIGRRDAGRAPTVLAVVIAGLGGLTIVATAALSKPTLVAFALGIFALVLALIVLFVHEVTAFSSRRPSDGRRTGDAEQEAQEDPAKDLNSRLGALDGAGVDKVIADLRAHVKPTTPVAPAPTLP